MRRRSVLFLIIGLSLSGCSDSVDPPADGTLAVSTSTSGDAPDPDGFHLTIDGSDSHALLPSGTAELGLSPGRHTLELVGVAEHCSVTPGTSVEVDITAGTTTSVAFQVTCALTGARITVTTTGLDLDPDGYRVVVDGSDIMAVAANGYVTTRLGPGSRTISLAGLAPNCAVEGAAAQTVTIVTAEVATIDFVVVCTDVSLGGHIWGKVLGAAGCIRGAMVEIVAGPGLGRTSSQTDTCDPWDEGGFFFDDLPWGTTVTLRATAPGYQPKDSVVVVPAGGEAVDFVLQSAPTNGFIWGQVLSQTGPCIRGAVVMIVNGPGTGRQSGQPDDCDAWDYTGFEFDDLPVGATVTLRAEGPGYSSEDREVKVQNPTAGVGPVQFSLIAEPRPSTRQVDNH